MHNLKDLKEATAMGRNRLIFLGSWKDKKNRFKLQQDKWDEEIRQNVETTVELIAKVDCEISVLENVC